MMDIDDDFYIFLVISLIVFLFCPAVMYRQIKNPNPPSITINEDKITIVWPIELEPYLTPNIFYIAHLTHYRAKNIWLDFGQWYNNGHGWNAPGEPWPWWAKIIDWYFFKKKT